jgi:tetratricopeptide (TPR) repeat protein
MKRLVGWFRDRTREQWVLLVVLLVLGPGAIGSVAVFEWPAEAPVPPPDRKPPTAPPVPVEFPVADPAAYGGSGPSLWVVEAGARLPLTELPEPSAAPPKLCVPPFSPAPPMELLYADPEPLALGGSLPPHMLLPQDRLDALLALTVAEPTPRPDLRGQRRHEWDVLVLDNDQRTEGEILTIAEDGSVLIESPARSGNKITVKKGRIKSMERRFTNLERFQQARGALRPPDARGRATLAEQTLAWGMMPETIALLEEAHALDPGEETVIGRLADLYEETAAHEKAAALLAEAARRARGRREPFSWRLGRLLERIGLPEAALAAYRAAGPAVPEALIDQAWVELRLGDLEAARAGVRAASPSAESHLLSALIALAEPVGAQETAAARLQKVKAAASVAAAAPAPPPAILARLRLLEGVLAMLERAPGALERWADALALDPDLTAAWVNLGIAYLIGGKGAEARGLFKQASDRDPASADAWIGTALALRLAGDEAGAAAALEQALKIRPDHDYPGYLRAMTAPEAASAASDFAALLKRRFDFAPAWAPAGLALARQARRAGPAEARERWSQAEALLRRAAGSARAVGPRLALVDLLLDHGRVAEARRVLEQTEAGGPKDEAALLYARGYVEYRAGESVDEKRVQELLAGFFKPSAEAGYEPAREAVDRVADWLLTHVILEETFDGEDGTDVAGRWDPRLKTGVRAVYDKGAALLVGAAQERGISHIETGFAGEEFWRAEATFRVGTMEFRDAGISLYDTKGSDGDWRGIHVTLQRQGPKVAFRTDVAAMAQVAGGTILGKEVADAPLPKEKFVVRLQRVGPERGGKIQVLVRVDDVADWKILEEGIPSGYGGGPMRLALFGGSPPQEPLRLRVQEVRVYTRARR